MSEETQDSDPSGSEPETTSVREELEAAELPVWQQTLQQWRTKLTELSPMWRLGLLSGAGILVAAAWLFGSAASSEMETLYSGLSADDQSRIQERLGRSGVPFETVEDGILVPANQVHETRLTLAGEGLPAGGGAGFELFDEQRFGESEFSEQVQYHRALEGELARTIGHLAGVERARVHLVLPQRSLFVNRDGSASASIVLHLRGGWRVRAEQAAGIVHLVASSVRGLEVEDVTLVDGEGRDLSGDQGEDAPGDALAWQRRIEREEQRSLQVLLDETLGPGVARVRVSAEVNFRREEQTEERYHPDEVAARSFQIDEERNPDAAQDAQGIPGAASNLPGGAPAEGGTTEAGVVRRSETRNFEISKTVRHAIEPVGQVARKSIAVVVDGVWEGDEFTARDEEELARIESFISSAAGINAERGDQITVTCVPFSRDADEDAAVDPFAEYRPYLPYAIAGAVGLVLLIIFFIIWRRRRKRKKETKKLAAELAAKVASGEMTEGEAKAAALLEAGENGDEDEVEKLAQGSIRDLLLGDPAGLDPELATEAQALASELALEDPARAARILRGWLIADLDDNENKEEEAA